MLRTALLAFALSPAVAAAADGAATKAAAPDLSALIECRLGHADFMAYMPVLQDPLKAVALGWRPLPQSNPFMVEYRLNAPVTVFGRSSDHIAFAGEGVVAVLDLPDPRVLARELQLETAIDTIRAGLADEAFSTAWESGRSLSIDHAIARVLDFDNRAASRASFSLTPRESEVLRLLATGMTDPEIADTLGRRVSFLLSVSVLGATTLMYVGLAQVEAGVVEFALVSVLMGLGFTFYSGAMEAWLVDALAATGYRGLLDRVFARGQQITGAAMLVGTVGGGLLGQIDLSIPYPPTAGPGGSFGIVGLGTPIDADRTAVFFWRYRKVSGWERDTWRFLYRTKLEARHWHVLEQDREMLELMASDADQAENLYQHDLGVVRLRRLYRTLAEEQAGVSS